MKGIGSRPTPCGRAGGEDKRCRFLGCSGVAHGTPVIISAEIRLVLTGVKGHGKAELAFGVGLVGNTRSRRWRAIFRTGRTRNRSAVRRVASSSWDNPGRGSKRLIPAKKDVDRERKGRSPQLASKSSVGRST